MMKKLKLIRYTISIYCEGKTDYLFSCYLKKLYLTRGSKQITLKRGTGGDISTFISNTVKNAQIRDYDEKFIVLDADQKTKNELKKAEQQSFKEKIKIIWQKLCLEGLFLRILKNNQHTQKTSKECKNLFYKEYNPNNKPLEDLLNTLFPKELLETKRQEVAELDQLIKLMEPPHKKV